MEIKFFSGFSKKYNSTKVPLVADATKTCTGYLKEPCSIMNPVFRIERPVSDAAPYSYTYAYIGSFGRWYFVNDWLWADGVWECHLEEDVLASFKTQIGNSTEYVLRNDSTTIYNGEITDTTYPATTDVVTETVQGLNAFTDDISVGCYIVGIISGGRANAVGAISYYVMTSTEFGNLKQALLSDANLTSMGIISGGVPAVYDVSPEILKTLYNPYQYIASCMWFPFPESLILDKTAVSQIEIGWWPYNLSGYSLYAQTIDVAEQPFQFIEHPQSSLRGSYLNYAPYSKRYLIGRFGTVALDSADYKPNDGIDISYTVDLITGQCRTKIGRMRNSEYDLLTERQFLLAVPVQIAQVGVDYLGTVASAVSTTANTIGKAVSLDVGGAIASATSGIYNTLQTAMPQLETSGSNGSFLSAVFPTSCVSQFYKIVDEDIEHRGRPVCELKQLSTLSGFTLCAEGELDLNCFDNERKKIAEYLTTGFFME